MATSQPQKLVLGEQSKLHAYMGLLAYCHDVDYRSRAVSFLSFDRVAADYPTLFAVLDKDGMTEDNRLRRHTLRPSMTGPSRADRESISSFALVKIGQTEKFLCELGINLTEQILEIRLLGFLSDVYQELCSDHKLFVNPDMFRPISVDTESQLRDMNAIPVPRTLNATQEYGGVGPSLLAGVRSCLVLLGGEYDFGAHGIDLSDTYQLLFFPGSADTNQPSLKEDLASMKASMKEDLQGLSNRLSRLETGYKFQPKAEEGVLDVKKEEGAQDNDNDGDKTQTSVTPATTTINNAMSLPCNSMEELEKSFANEDNVKALRKSLDPIMDVMGGHTLVFAQYVLKTTLTPVFASTLTVNKWG